MNAKSRFDPAETEVSIIGLGGISETSVGGKNAKALIFRYLRVSLL